jgi:hypothetical protein
MRDGYRRAAGAKPLLASPFPRGPSAGTRDDMGYVIAGILVLLLVAGFVTFMVMNSATKGGAPSIDPDPSPLGDTTQHTSETPGPERPSRPEERQLGDAGAGTGPQPGSERLADRPQ